MASNIPTESTTYDNLFAGSQQGIVTQKGTIITGSGKLARGCVLGRITASGKLGPVNKALATGQEKVYAVLAQAVDATSADVTNAPIYMTGEFRTQSLTFGSTDTAADHKYTAELANIYFRDAVV